MAKKATPPTPDEEGQVNYNMDGVYDTETKSLRERGYKVASRPPMIKPKLWEVGKTISGTIKEIVDSYKKEFKSKIMILERANGSLIGIPLVGSIKNVILNDKEKCDHIGKEVAITKTPHVGVTTKYQDDEGKARRFPIFEVGFKD